MLWKSFWTSHLQMLSGIELVGKREYQKVHSKASGYAYWSLGEQTLQIHGFKLVPKTLEICEFTQISQIFAKNLHKNPFKNPCI